jgi:Uma2 family endonuclease
MAELVDGRLEILPMPTWLHQLIVDHLLSSLKEYLSNTDLGGVVLFAPLPTRLFPRTIREPDVLYASPENVPEDPNGYPEKLDFVVEVVSSGADARKRDYEDKPRDYARAGISEYWIVDPEQWRITVLGLRGETYEILGEYTAGDKARSCYFEGLSINVNDLVALSKKKK